MYIMDTLSFVRRTKDHKRLLRISWKEVVEGCRGFACRIKKICPECTGFYPIPRGGLVPAVILSHLTNLPLHKELQPTSIIVDDVEDSGLTLSGYTGKYKCFVLVTKRLDSVCYYSRLTKKDTWVVFPWEVD